MSIASDGGPAELVTKAVNALGGMDNFVKRGSFVVIKPNLAWERRPEQAANTNPEIITTVIKLCQRAGAGRIVVVDHTCDNARAAFEMNGANDAVRDADARLYSADNRRMYKEIDIPHGKVLKSAECIRDILEADVFINIPIAKVHGASTITASMKNMMGTCWDRGAWHSSNLEQCIADYSTAVRPNLIILDAYRILTTRGPKGPGDVKNVGQVAASTDPVAIDAYAATLLGRRPESIKHIAYAADMGVGEIDLDKVRVKRV
jgi:uncharacterized protein (DUF362 family)